MDLIADSDEKYPIEFDKDGFSKMYTLTKPLQRGDMVQIIDGHLCVNRANKSPTSNNGWNHDMTQAPKDGTAILVYATDQAYAKEGSDNWHFYICPARWNGRMWSGWPLNTHYWPKAWMPLEVIGKFNPAPLKTGE